MSKEKEYREIFLAEALENLEELNRLMTMLEKEPGEEKSVHAIFRITHTLKGNATGMGYKSVAELAHVLEDLFGEVREGRLVLDSPVFASLFKALDTLGELIRALEDGRKVRYRGIKTKLEVLLRSTPVPKTGPGQESRAMEQEGEAGTIGNAKDLPREQESEPLAKEGALTVTGPTATPQEEGIREVPQAQADETQKEGEEVNNAAQAVTDNTVTFSDIVQVPVRKLDDLLNLVGELVIERDRILSSHAGRLGANEYSRLNRISSDLQYSVMDVRLVQVGFLFNKFHRVLRDAASLEKKKVSLTLEGTETEIDRNILQIISDSLIHLVRNAVGHGIEDPGARKEAGKPAEGTITLRAFSEGDSVTIEVKDDGRGIDADSVREKAMSKGLLTKEDARHMPSKDVILLIFEPGFSTVDAVTSISGRGVGMDVVKKALESVGGNISVETEKGKGTTFALKLPSSMAVKATLLFELAKETYAIPLSFTEAVVSLYKKDIHKVGNGLVATYLDNTISVVFLKDIFAVPADRPVAGQKILHKSFDVLHDEQKLDIVIVSYNGRTVGFVVDKLLQQKEIVEKPLSKPFDTIKVLSGVTIMGNGHVCLVLNVAAICNRVFTKNLSHTNVMSH